MKKILLTTVLTFAIVLGAIGKNVIAVLPYDINYDGRIPKRLDSTNLATLRSQESRFYQASMINYLTKQNSKARFRKANTSILSQNQVAALMIEKGLSEKDLAILTNEKLAEILEVSHVVRGSATRTFIMSEELSAGITAISILTGNQGVLPTATSSLNIINTLENVSKNNTIYSRQFRRNTSVTRTDEQRIRSRFNASSRKMLRIIKRNMKNN